MVGWGRGGQRVGLQIFVHGNPEGFEMCVCLCGTLLHQPPYNALA